MALAKAQLQLRSACAPVHYVHRAVCVRRSIAKRALADEVVQPGQRSQQVPNFSGSWIKDIKASEPMERAMQLAQLNMLMQQAVRLITGINIKQGPSSFQLEVVSVISWFKIIEKYTMDGRKSGNMRRDLRLGSMQGAMTLGALPATLALDYEWSDPVKGTGTDVFSQPNQDTLHVDSVVRIGGKQEAYRTVYRRQK